MPTASWTGQSFELALEIGHGAVGVGVVGDGLLGGLVALDGGCCATSWPSLSASARIFRGRVDGHAGFLGVKAG
jgi:hypothetical protein